MRKLLVAMALLGAIAAAPAHAAPVAHPVLGSILDQGAAVQPVQYGYNRREAIRRQEFRRRQAIRRQDFRRRQAYRRGYRY